MLNERVVLSRQSGFTLIELVMVIVILGILAAFALPRFADLRSDSNLAALKAMGGAIKSAASIVHAKALVEGVQNQKTATIDLDGDGVEEVGIRYGYPSAKRAEGIPRIMGGGFENDWSWSTYNAPRRFVLSTALMGGGPGQKISNVRVEKNNCYLIYDRANSPGASPKITYFTTGC